MEKLVLTQRKLSEIKNGLVNGLTVASGAKSSATYYHTRDEQSKAITKSVNDLYNVSKELPLILANQKGVTGKFIQEVLLNEFENSVNGGACNIVNPVEWVDNELCDKAIFNALQTLDGDNGITYVLRMFNTFKTRKINNERSRKILFQFIIGHNNLEFVSIKYRNKISEILKHAYGEKKLSILLNIGEKFVKNSGLYSNNKEYNIAKKYLLRYSTIDPMNLYKIMLFIFKRGDGLDYSFSKSISSFYSAKNGDILKVNNIPEEVLIGLISNKKHNQYNELWSTEEKREKTKGLFRENVKVTTVTQQVRQTKSTQKLGVNKQVDLSTATDFMSLYKTGYETEFTSEIKKSINNLAKKDAYKNFSYNNIGIILDKSPSMKGHNLESKNTPRAIASYTSLVLKNSALKSKLVGVEGVQTDLASGFVELLKMENDSEYDAIFILSDGYENSYESQLSEVVDIYLKETNRVLPIYHVSPITGAEVGGQTRSLGDNLVSLSINKPSGLVTQINSKLLEIDVKLWLERELLSIEKTPVKRLGK